MVVAIRTIRATRVVNATPPGAPDATRGRRIVAAAEGIRPIWGYLLALMVGLIIVAIFPWISIGFL